MSDIFKIVLPIPDDPDLGWDDTEEEKAFRDEVRSAMQGQRDYPETDTMWKLGILTEMLSATTEKEKQERMQTPADRPGMITRKVDMSDPVNRELVCACLKECPEIYKAWYFCFDGEEKGSESINLIIEEDDNYFISLVSYAMPIMGLKKTFKTTVRLFRHEQTVHPFFREVENRKVLIYEKPADNITIDYDRYRAPDGVYDTDEYLEVDYRGITLHLKRKEYEDYVRYKGHAPDHHVIDQYLMIDSDKSTMDMRLLISGLTLEKMEERVNLYLWIENGVYRM